MLKGRFLKTRVYFTIWHYSHPMTIISVLCYFLMTKLIWVSQLTSLLLLCHPWNTFKLPLLPVIRSLWNWLLYCSFVWRWSLPFCLLSQSHNDTISLFTHLMSTESCHVGWHLFHQCPPKYSWAQILKWAMSLVFFLAQCVLYDLSKPNI